MERTTFDRTGLFKSLLVQEIEKKTKGTVKKISIEYSINDFGVICKALIIVNGEDYYCEKLLPELDRIDGRHIHTLAQYWAELIEDKIIRANSGVLQTGEK